MTKEHRKKLSESAKNRKRLYPVHTAQPWSGIKPTFPNSIETIYRFNDKYKLYLEGNETIFNEETYEQNITKFI